MHGKDVSFQACARAAEWTAAVQDLQRVGHVLLRNAVHQRDLPELQDAIRLQTLRRAPETIGSVRQRTEMLVLPAVEWVVGSPIRDVAHWLAESVGIPGWKPNEATVTGFRGSQSWISPHRDHRRYKILIAIVSVTGHGRFQIVNDRGGREILNEWTVAPGDVTLLRGMSSCKTHQGDPRPLHSVVGRGDEYRLSLSFRMIQSETE